MASQRFVLAGRKQQNLGKSQKSFSLFWIIVAIIILGLLYNFMVSENYKRTNLTTEDLKICAVDFNSEDFDFKDCLNHLVKEDKKEAPMLDDLFEVMFTSSRDLTSSEG